MKTANYQVQTPKLILSGIITINPEEKIITIKQCWQIIQSSNSFLILPENEITNHYFKKMLL